jgi:ribose transport system substrate-binding protein
MMPLKPDVLIAAPTDATTGAATFQHAVDAGILLSFVSIIPTGYVRGKDYIGVSTANAHGLKDRICYNSQDTRISTYHM